ncbi:MAG: hypothetical protein K5765_07320 [Clostridia bacterium]|nr:hypothetical protein [Clostridia bacterium]
MSKKKTKKVLTEYEKHLKKDVSILITVIVCAFVFFAVLNLKYYLYDVGPTFSKLSDVENPYGFTRLAVEPDNVKTGVNLKEQYDSLTEDQYRDFAIQTHDFACEYAKNALYLTVYDKAVVNMSLFGSITTLKVDSLIMKSQYEYFKNMYKFIEEFPLADSPIGKLIIATTGITCGERMYATRQSTKLGYQMVNNSLVKEDGTAGANWSNFTHEMIKYRDYLPRFNSTLDGKFLITSLHNLTNNTVSDFNIEYNEEDNTFTIEYVLDTSLEEEYRYTLLEITEGTGDPNAYYSKAIIKVTYYNSGLIKEFYTSETWNANVSAFKVFQTFDMDSTYYVSYAREDCYLTKCSDIAEAKNWLPVK